MKQCINLKHHLKVRKVKKALDKLWQLWQMLLANAFSGEKKTTLLKLPRNKSSGLITYSKTKLI